MSYEDYEFTPNTSEDELWEGQALARRLKRLEREAWQTLARNAPNVTLRKAYLWRAMKLMLELNEVRFPNMMCGGYIPFL